MYKAPLKPAKRELDTYVCKKPQRRISVRQATVADIHPLMRQARAEIGSALAEPGHIARIIAHNGECIWVVERTSPRDGTRLCGFHAFLPLTAEGETALMRGGFDYRQPQLRHVATAGEPPTALYWWASLGMGTSATAITLIMERLRRPRYRHLDIYSRPVTRHGARALLNVGFYPLSGGDPVGSLVLYRRLANRPGSGLSHFN